MKYSHFFGAAVPECGWVPAPAYLLRRAAILRLMRQLPRGTILEYGCGPGALLLDLSELGFQPYGVEPSAQARGIARSLLATPPKIHIAPDPPAEPLWFDYVLAFEVLEHIEDDRGALQSWVQRLQTGGRLILSVPAHQKRWSQDDLWAGHFRRYERAGLTQLLGDCGLDIEQIACYGWPLGNLIAPLRIRHHGRLLDRGSDRNDIRLRTLGSGVERGFESRFYSLYANIFTIPIFFMCAHLQRVAYKFETGIGYIVCAKKR